MFRFEVGDKVRVHNANNLKLPENVWNKIGKIATITEVGPHDSYKVDIAEDDKWWHLDVLYPNLQEAPKEEFRIISSSRLAELLCIENRLKALESNGVDNWGGYEDSFSLHPHRGADSLIASEVGEDIDFLNKNYPKTDLKG